MHEARVPIELVATASKPEEGILSYPYVSAECNLEAFEPSTEVTLYISPGVSYVKVSRPTIDGMLFTMVFPVVGVTQTLRLMPGQLKVPGSALNSLFKVEVYSTLGRRGESLDLVRGSIPSPAELVSLVEEEDSDSESTSERDKVKSLAPSPEGSSKTFYNGISRVQRRLKSFHLALLG